VASSRKPKYKPSDKDKRALDFARKCIEEGARWHRSFTERVERRYDAYRGMAAEQVTKTWRSNLHPPYLINIVEGMLASMEETVPYWEVSPKVVPGMSLEEAIDMSDRAELNEALLNCQFSEDDFGFKQRPFGQQDLIAGFSVGKVSWLRENSSRRFFKEDPELIFDEAGGSISIANVLNEYEEDYLAFDGPHFEVRDVRDWMTTESATSIKTAPWVLDRTFVHLKTIYRMEEMGLYENTEFVTQDYRATTKQADVEARREQGLRGADRTRGLVEIVEVWTDDSVITVANREVVIRNEPNPFHHGEKPFVVASAIPDMFQIPGISVIEGLAQMQEMLWSLMNQRLDVTKMASNLITLIRGDVDNAGDFEWAPLAQWIVDDPNQVRTLDIDPQIANITLQAEALLRGDLNSVMGALPQVGGENQQFDQQTATGISIITNIAQLVLAGRKRNYTRCFGKVGEMFAKLNGQYLHEERLLEVIGPGGTRR
jgi:hypothetical protein